MRSRLYMGLTIVLTIAILASPMQMASGAEPGRLAALTARQGLRDKICIAMADGQIDRGERYAILSQAKVILTPDEYKGLKRAMDRLSPPSSSAKPTIPPGAILADRMAWAASVR